MKKELDPEMVSFDWKCEECGAVDSISYAELALGAPPTCGDCDGKMEIILKA